MVDINKNYCQTDCFGCLDTGNGARPALGEEIWEKIWFSISSSSAILEVLEGE